MEINQWHKNKFGNESYFKILEEKIGMQLPSQYKQFMIFSNGGEGQIGDNYISLWPIENILPLNEDYKYQNIFLKSF